MKNTCWKCFSYLVVDRAAAQARLNELAAQGWELVKLRSPGLAKFRRTERTDLTYFLDFRDPNAPREEEDPYIQLCADAGWTRVEQLDYWDIYASQPGLRPAPIQTDPQLDYERYRKKVARRSAIGTAFILGLLAFYAVIILATPSSRSLWWEVLFFSLPRTLTLGLLLPLLPPLLAGGVAYWLALLLRMRRWRRDAGQGLPLSSHGPWATKVWGILRLAGFSILALSFSLLLPLDALLNGTVNWGWPLGAFIGSALVLTSQSATPKRKQDVLHLLVLAGVVLVCMLLHGPVRQHFPGRIPPPSLLTTADADLEDSKRTDGLWGSCADWSERPEWDREAGLYPYLDVRAETWTVPCLADLSLRHHLERGDYLPAGEGVYRVPSDDPAWQAYLLRRGNTLLRLNWHDLPPSADPLQSAQAWLDSWA